MDSFVATVTTTHASGRELCLLLIAVEKRDRPAEPVTLDVHLVERESTAPR